jgi:hypothetical protein
MRITEVEANQRFTNDHFDPRLEFEGAISVGIYTCPHCKTQLHFNTSDFQRHLFSDRSDLPAAVQRYLSQHRPLSAAKGECFLDFQCQGCARAVRVIFEPWEFRMANYGFDVKSVVEVEE